MSDTDRRKFLAAAGGGTAAVGAAALLGASATSADAAGAPAKPARRSAAPATEPVVAFVEDHGSDRLRLMVGDREVVVHDRELVTRLLDAAGGH